MIKLNDLIDINLNWHEGYMLRIVFPDRKKRDDVVSLREAKHLYGDSEVFAFFNCVVYLK